MGRSGSQNYLGHRALSLAAIMLFSSFAVPASASPEPSARLVRCGEESCLRISGHRDSASAVVMINGNAVEAQGARRWQVHLPVDTLREWSAPFARTVNIALYNPAERQETSQSVVDLPIGLLGGVSQLDSMVVSAL